MLGLTESLVVFCTKFIATVGAPGITVLMTLESMIAPVPSEAVMPFAGFLWFEGKLTLLSIVISSTLGSIIGSLISYYLGAWGGEPIVKRWGKYLLLNEHHLEQTKAFFDRYGEKTIFVSRFIPIVRHFISIPAGVGRMNITKFLIYTAVGAALWNTFLAYVGYQLGSRWELVRKYSEVLDVVLVIAILGAAGYFIWRQLQKRKQSPKQEVSS